MLAIAEIFSVGLVVVALAPNQTAASAMGGVLFFVLLFLSGLWIQRCKPACRCGTSCGTRRAERALLYSVFNAAPPLVTLLTPVGYLRVRFVAVRYFRWE